ncbi:MAG: hypothetical protein GWM98_23130, partial [Nitrospinaceae bacterium]|nr:hypothetical protein [Nitrospinaceae bacterium]NIR56822.1 hypothetical protein [Nitrospinaceae bacterium]NIS87286.1 hypothetical protein [Nitrospinaceae bacterium]NIT84142.1 hypothetical protein [Nitrospinaceae bacterium]NIU46327.1 hypothetical protein [Nitrospinaceae bacterium]
MAQKVAEPANLEELDKTEADELERLLSETEEGETPEGSRFRRGLLVLLQNKKWLWTGVAALGV